MNRVHVDIKGLALPEELLAIDQTLVGLGAVRHDDVVPPHYQFKHDDPAALRDEVRRRLGADVFHKLAWVTFAAQ